MGNGIDMNNAIDFHSRRAITSLFAILEASQIEASDGSLERTVVDNFQIKILLDSTLHSLRSLYSIAWDLTQWRELNSNIPFDEALQTHNRALESLTKWQLNDLEDSK